MAAIMYLIKKRDGFIGILTCIRDAKLSRMPLRLSKIEARLPMGWMRSKQIANRVLKLLLFACDPTLLGGV
jgi:hypothetical protein